MLCKICEKALSHSQIRAKFCPHHSSVESLEESVRAQCFICCTLWHHVFGQYTRDGELATSTLGTSQTLSKAASGLSGSLESISGASVASSSQENSLLFTKEYSHFRKLNFDRVRVMNDESGLSCIAVWMAGAELWESLFTFIPEDFLQNVFPQEGNMLLEDIKRPTAFPVSPENIELLESWLNSCITSHESCHGIGNSKEWLPERLLDIVGHDFVTLIDTARPKCQPKQYATLSHRWQSSQPVECKRGTISHLRRGMPVRDLPKTYQDAIYLAKKLRIDYIWIDSLCIIQDDEADWLAQAPQMDRIYANSLVNISATGARTSDEGLFFAEQSSVAAPCAVNFWHLKDRGSCIIASNRLWSEELDKAPLNSRAWVLQERLLAPRIMHFGRRQVFWECNTCTRSQQFRGGLPSTLSSTEEGSIDLRRDHLFQGAGRETRMFAWLAIVERYSSCEMTFPEDKLLAIAGLARSFDSTFCGGYLAGVWRLELPAHLLWQTSGLSRSASRPKQYRAPSWSWAAIDGSVSYLPESRMFLSFQEVSAFVVLVKFLETRTDTIDGDPFTPCLFGRIRFLGHLIPIVPNILGYHSPVKFSFAFTGAWETGLQDAGVISRAWALPDIPIDPEELSKRYQFLPILSRRISGTEHRLLGLFLEVAVPRQSVYRRVGFVDVLLKLLEPNEPQGMRDVLQGLGRPTTINMI